RWAAQIGAVKADGVRRGSACNENANQMHSGPARRRLPEAHCCTHWSGAGSRRSVLHQRRRFDLPGEREIPSSYLTSKQVDVFFRCEGPGHTERRSACVCTTPPEEQSETV